MSCHEVFLNETSLRRPCSNKIWVNPVTHFINHLKKVFMKGNYMTYYVLKACLSHKKAPGKDIHSRLAETIAERKKILSRYEEMLLAKVPNAKKDIHSQLAETLAERKRIFQRLHQVLTGRNSDPLILSSQKA